MAIRKKANMIPAHTTSVAKAQSQFRVDRIA